MELRALSGQLENGSEREENLHGSCEPRLPSYANDPADDPAQPDSSRFEPRGPKPCAS